MSKRIRRHAEELNYRTNLEPLEPRYVLSGGAIAGAVFHDLNGNGTQDGGESGLGGATVFLDANKNGALDGGETATTTLADGSYGFSGLAAGDYTVAQVLPTGWLQTAAGSPGVGRMGEAIHSFAPAITSGEVNNAPLGMTWVNGELFQVENRTGANNLIWRLDPQTGAVLGSITPAFDVRDIAFDGTNLWGMSSDTIYHFATDGTLLHTFDAPGDVPIGLTWDGSHLWVLESATQGGPAWTTIYKLDVNDLSGPALPVVQSIAGPNLVSWAATFDGQHLWISAQADTGANNQPRLYQVDRGTGQILQTVTAPVFSHYSASPDVVIYGNIRGMAFDGHALWYTDSGVTGFDYVNTRRGARIVQLDPGGDHRDVTVVDGLASTAAAIGNAQLATISGKVFNDLNQDGDQDAGELGLAGRKVFLDHDGNGVLNTAETMVLTDAAGNYQLTGRVGRSYTVGQVLPPDWQQVSPASTGHAVSVAQSGQVLSGLNFADFLPVATKFFVVNDASPDRTYEYEVNRTAVENYALAAGNTAPRGAASNADGSIIWVIDANKTVYVYSYTGQLLGQWNAEYASKTALQFEGITVFGNDAWIVDAGRDRVSFYRGGAVARAASAPPDSDFALASGNKNPKDLVTDGTHIWVVDDANTNKVFKYTMTGTLVGSWTIASPNSTPTGITLDPTGASNDLWIVDSGTDKVYQYVGGKSWTSGTRSASATFNLSAGNTNPQGIADPPTGLTPATAPGSADTAALAVEAPVAAESPIAPTPGRAASAPGLALAFQAGSSPPGIGRQAAWTAALAEAHAEDATYDLLSRLATRPIADDALSSIGDRPVDRPARRLAATANAVWDSVELNRFDEEVIDGLLASLHGRSAGANGRT
jgi:hypothetical protein